MVCLPPLLDNLRGFIWSIVLSTSFLILAGLVLGVWLLCEIVFYFYLRYIVLPELNRLTTPEDSVHTPWDEFHKIIDVVSQLKVCCESQPSTLTHAPFNNSFLVICLISVVCCVCLFFSAAHPSSPSPCSPPYAKGSYAFEQFFSGWFLGSPIQDIRRGNVREMLAWALYSTAQSALTVRQKACVEDVSERGEDGRAGRGMECMWTCISTRLLDTLSESILKALLPSLSSRRCYTGLKCASRSTVPKATTLRSGRCC